MAAFSYTAPTVGGSENTWGDTLNANWAALDAFLGALDSAELAVLDGITATTAELNYTDGVTSNIQTQLDAKAPLASPALTGTATVVNATVSGALDVSAGTLTLADDQIAGAKVAASTTSTEGVVQIIDEDDMVSDSATRPPTQQSVKAYVDANGITQISGSAPYYGARAFANFYWDGSAIVIRASGNVASIARTATGKYTVTLTTAMSDSNYTIVGNFSNDDASPTGPNNDGQVIPYARTTTTFKLFTVDGAGGSEEADGSCNVVIFG